MQNPRRQTPVIAEQGGMPIEKAVEFVKQLKKDKRYQRDVY